MRNLLSLILFLSCIFNISAQVFFTESFEANNNYTTGSGGDCACINASSNANDGQNDYFARSTDGSISANTGNDYTGEVDLNGNIAEGSANYWAAEDIDDGGVQGTGNPEGCLVLSINIVGRINLEFSALFGAHSVNVNQYEMDNHMQIDYQIDGGGFVELLDFRESMDGSNMSLDTNGDDFGDGTTVIGQAFSPVAAAIPGSGTTLEIQICMNSNTSSEEFAVDFIQIAETAPLAVVLNNLIVKQENENVLMTWETIAETHNDYFLIERSTDGIHFNTIGNVPGNYSTSEVSKYSFVDSNLPKSNNLYYRLGQVDFDGIKTLSEVFFLAVNKRPLAIQLSPNPAQTQVNLTIDEHIRGDINIKIINANGQMIKTLFFGNVKRTIQIDVSFLPKGLYWLQMESSFHRQKINFVKINSK